MKYLLHGDDIVASRKFLTGLLEEYQVTELDGKNLNALNLSESLSSISLFDEKKAVVVENLLSKNSKKKEFVSFINSQNGSVLLVLWEDKKLPKTSFNSLKDITIRDFLLPQNYFRFLDSFYQGAGKNLFTMYHELLDSSTPEQIFYSLLKRLRLLVILDSKGKTDEILKMAPWQLQKLNNQLRHWKRESLLSFYEQLQETEIKLKTGKLPVSLSKYLDILILSQLI
jgi:DNA polymerase III delta subunit